MKVRVSLRNVYGLLLGGGYRIVLSGIAWFGLKPRVLHGMALCWVVFFGIACY